MILKANNCVIWISFMLFLITCPVIGQVTKTEQLSSSNYKLWSTLHAKEISSHGKWLSYELAYESGSDTLFVKSASTSQSFIFAKGHNGKFINNNWFACMLPKKQFQWVNLNTGETHKIENVQSFSVVYNNQYIMLFCNDNKGLSKIMIIDVLGNVLKSIANISSVALSPNKELLAYCTTNLNIAKVGLLHFGKKFKNTIVTANKADFFENISWQSNGGSIAFIARLKTAKAFTAHKVLHYNLDDKLLVQYNTTTQNSWPKDMILSANYASSLGVSDDGERVFFKIKKTSVSTSTKANSNVEVWNAADSDLYPMYNTYGTPNSYPRMAVWWPKTNKFRAIGDALQPLTILNGNQQIALTYNPSNNKPSFKLNSDRDYYLIDIDSGLKTPFLQNQSAAIGHLVMSPEGKYIAYFKDHNWWVYSIALKKHTNTTQNVSANFYDNSGDHPGDPDPYGIMGWTLNDSSLVVYDQFDVWEMKLEELAVKRHTRGREQQQIYRFYTSKRHSNSSLVSKEKGIDLEQQIILSTHAIDYNTSGYAILNKMKQVIPLVYEPKFISGLRKTKINNSFLYVQEDFNQPPELILKNKSGLSTIIFKSNPQHHNYNWGSSKLITYKNSKGVSLNGVLYYPFNYSPKKSYPMIVSIYEKQTAFLHKYSNPTLLNQGAGFNISNTLSQGYFVLLPDIVYEIGNPGFSALDCVLAATKSALKIAPINKNKMGLIGSSFGGYETNFIITQSNMFSAAVAGCGLSDLTSSYFSMGWGDLKPNMWRFENSQFRMGKTWFENREGYRSNSPINAVSNVNTPLLTYSGKEDTQVNPSQSMQFYLALRRLKKEHIMLLYPNENHAIVNPKNQRDITQRISDWFGFYLKDLEKPDWFTSK